MTNNVFYLLDIWLTTNERTNSWIARRLEINRVTISQWRKQNKVPMQSKLAICYVTGTSYEQLWEEV
jgi:transposase-like protein|tara:strand:- start:1120 stop:1320 length:201 start_codon:yes stop_codon:yes gene_type:complete